MFSRILSFFYPTLCASCGLEDRFTHRFGVCLSCIRKRRLAQAERNQFPHCRVCSQILLADGHCDFCSTRFVFFDQVISLRFRLGWERKIFQNCKFQNEKLLGNYFALDFSRKRNELIDLPNRIVLIPSKDRKNGRDFHPAFRLAERLAKTWGLQVKDDLEKISRDKQSGKKYFERFLHAKKAFGIRKNARMPEGFHILIIDDIFTTGASLNEVARMYLENGARKVSCMVLLSNEGD